MRVERTKFAVRNYEPRERAAPTKPDPLDHLVAGLARLARHRGFARGEIGSPLLQRLVPVMRPGQKNLEPGNLESELRERLVGAKLDPGRVAYLLQNAILELDLARARLAG